MARINEQLKIDQEALAAQSESLHGREQAVSLLIDQLDAITLHEAYESDPGLKPYVQQVRNHLKHASFDYRIAADSQDYPYELHQEGPYAQTPTGRAIARAQRMQDCLVAS